MPLATWPEGTWRAADFFRAHNEHRIFWTKALDVVLLEANGQWDPLVQLTANALVRAGAAALLAWWLARGASAGGASAGCRVYCGHDPGQHLVARQRTGLRVRRYQAIPPRRGAPRPGTGGIDRPPVARR